MRVSDVGRTELGTEVPDVEISYGGLPATAFAIRQEARANALDTVARIKAKMDELSAFFPPGVKVVYPFDTTPFVRVAINEVVRTLIEDHLPRLPRHVSLLREFPGHDHPDDRRPGRHPRDVRGPRPLRLLDQHADDVRHGPGDPGSSSTTRSSSWNVERVMSEEESRRSGGDEEVDGGDLERARRDRPRPGRRLRADDLLPSSTGVIYRQFSVTVIASMLLSVVVALILTPVLCASLLKPSRRGTRPRGRLRLLRPFFLWFDRTFYRSRDLYMAVVRHVLGRRARYLVVAP